jgi:DNA-binding transcriptional LysR family regulator
MKTGEIDCFQALMNSGSARKAAALLGITQPAVSQSIQRLERQAGFALFQRLNGRMLPTPEAHALLAEVQRMYVGLNAIEHKLRSLRDHGVNQLDIACYPAFGLSFMPRVLARWQREMQPSAALGSAAKALPHVSLQVLSSSEVHKRVSAGRSDFGLMADELPFEGLDHSPFARFAGVVVMPADHALARFRKVTPAQLAQVSFIALNPEDASRGRLDAALAEHGVQLRVVAHTPYAVSVCEMALQGMGVGLVNPVTALDYAERGGLVVRRLSIDVSFACELVLPAGRVPSGHLQQLLQVMRKQLQEDDKRLAQYLRPDS